MSIVRCEHCDRYIDLDYIDSCDDDDNTTCAISIYNGSVNETK